MGLAQLMMYSSPFAFGKFMCYTVDYNKAFVKSVAIKNVDTTIEQVAKIFNKRRKEMRERGAEERAMEKQDYSELMVQMERNEILMLTHQFRDMRLEDVFLAYY